MTSLIVRAENTCLQYNGVKTEVKASIEARASIDSMKENDVPWQPYIASLIVRAENWCLQYNGVKASIEARASVEGERC